MHGAGAALRKAATESRSLECEIVAQGVEQRHVRIVDPDPDPIAVHGKGFAGHMLLPNCFTLLQGGLGKKQVAYPKCTLLATPSIARPSLSRVGSAGRKSGAVRSCSAF